MDKRILKDGRIRLRFKLSDRAYALVEKALRATRSSYSHVALDYISLDFISGSYLVHSPRFYTKGGNRLLVKFYPDQYQTFIDALDIAKETFADDTDALVAICENFLHSDKSFLN